MVFLICLPLPHLKGKEERFFKKENENENLLNSPFVFLLFLMDWSHHILKLGEEFMESCFEYLKKKNIL